MSNINDYQDYVLYTINNIQFNKNDGISTTQIVNIDITDSGNYLLVCNDQDIIESRWYIVESKWLRQGQTQLTLVRDIIDDYIDKVLDSTCIVERAMVNHDNPLIYNQEKISVNQIKTSETLLKDETGVPWLVAYIAKNKGINITDEEDLKANAYYKQGATLADLPLMSFFPAITGSTYNQSANIEIYDPAAVNFNTYCAGDDATDLEDSRVYKMAIKAGEAIKVPQDGTEFLQTSSKIYNGNYNAGITSPYWLGTSNGGIGKASYDDGPGQVPVDFTGTSDIWVNPHKMDTAFAEYKNNLEQSPDFQLNILKYLAEIGYTYDVYDANFNPSITQYNDRIYRISGVDASHNRYFKYNVSAVSSDRQFIYFGADADSDLAVNFRRFLVDQFGDGMYLDPQYGIMFSFAFPSTKYRVTITEVTPESIKASELDGPNGAYNMICSPYADIDLVSDSLGTITTISKENILKQYQAIANNNPGIVYDVQLLPYCPCRNKIVNMDSIQNNRYIEVSDSITSTIISITNERQSFLILDNTIDAETTAVARKKNIICNLHRLCDPGYNGVFEFSAEKNNGVIYWNVDMTVKPYQPFIHVAPNFGGLYGSDFNDARGLTLGSNFSITSTSDKFAEYEVQNKNYQQMFNRQIQNMEVTHDIQDIEQAAQIMTGTVGGAGSGAFASGMLSGSTKVAGAGSGIGAGLSLIGGAVDAYTLDKRQSEELAYAKDMHNYQLDNIKALPDALTRVSIFNNIYKDFPFVEFYTCTDAEKQIVENYITWQSMNVNAIGTLSDYITSQRTFVKAIPLRLSIPEDDHVAIALTNELSNGIYI